MALSFDELAPKLHEARARYHASAVEAFAGVEPRLCGVEVLPFTPRMFVELDGSGNRFLSGREEPRMEDVAAFLWRISPVYNRIDSAMRSDFIFALPIALYPSSDQEVVSQIFEYMRRAWAGMPLFKGKTSKQQSISTWISHLVHMFAKEYGWTEEYILDLPFRRLWQYANRVLEEQNPKYREMCDEEQALRAAWLQEQNQSN